MEKINYIYEDFLDDLGAIEQPSSAKRVQQNIPDEVVYIQADPSKFKYVMDIHFVIKNTYTIYDKDPELFNIDFGRMYEEFVYICNASMIDGKFYISPIYFWDENKSKDDYQNYMFRIEPIQFEFPYPEKFDLRDVYKGNTRSSLNCPRFKFSIYFDDVCYYPFKTFISRWRMMMNMMDRALKETKVFSGGEIDAVHENTNPYPREQYISNMYVNGYNSNYDDYKRLYKMFFAEVPPEYQGGESYGGRKNDATDRMLRRFHLEEIAKQTEKYNGEFGISVEYCQNEFDNRGEHDSVAWISFKVHTDDTEVLDMVSVENFIMKNFLIHIPSIYYNHIHICVFFKSDFTGPKIINSREDEEKSRGFTRRRYSDDVDLNKGESYAARYAGRLEYYIQNGSGNRKKEERFRKYWFDGMGSSSEFLIYFGDKNGKLGKTPFKEKLYCGYSCVNKFNDVLEKIDNDVDIWAKKD